MTLNTRSNFNISTDGIVRHPGMPMTTRNLGSLVKPPLFERRKNSQGISSGNNTAVATRLYKQPVVHDHFKRITNHFENQR